MRRAISTLLLLFILLPLFAIGGRIIPLDDETYLDVEALFLINGVSGVSSSRPWSESEVRLMLRRLDYEGMDPFSKKLYEKISSSLESDEYYFKPSLELAPELYYHPNGKVFKRSEHWVYGFNERKPFLKASIDASLGPFYTYTELSYGHGMVTNEDTFITLEELSGDDFPGLGAVVSKEEGGAIRVQDVSKVYSSTFLFNFPKMTAIEIDVPRRTSFSFSFDNLSFGFLRDRLSWGRSRIGNFIFDDHVSRMDYLYLKLYYERFSFDYVLYLPEVNHTNTNDWDYKEKTRLMLAHMLSYRILDNLFFSISENVMYSFTVPELYFFNPANIFHNLSNAHTLNAIAHLELEYVPIKGLRFYTQFVLDQATAPTEGDSQPAAFGVSLAAEYMMGISDALLSFYAEGAYTSPYLYRRQTVDFIVFNRYSINKPYGKFPVFTYIGFPYGGDALSVYFETRYRIPGGINASLNLLYMIHGEVGMLSPHSKDGNNSSAPNIKTDEMLTGDLSHSVRLSLDLRYPYSVSIFDIEGFINLSYLYQERAHDFQLALGASVKI